MNDSSMNDSSMNDSSMNDSSMNDNSTYDEYYNKIKRDGMYLKDVPNHHHTYELLLQAVKQNGLAIQFVDFKFNYVIDNNDENNTDNKIIIDIPGSALVQMIHHDKTFDIDYEELCHVAVKQNGLAIKSIPEIFIASELCMEAVKQNGLALKFVPSAYKTIKYYSILVLAMEQNGLALQYVPIKFRGIKLCEYAIKQNIAAMKYVKKNKTFLLNMCPINHMSYDFISDHYNMTITI
jgi:predicted SAM-dependent methyltransferase